MRTHAKDRRGMFQAWRQWAKFMLMHREHKKKARTLQKQRVADLLLLQARIAADKHDTHGTYKVVRMLAPKLPRKSLQLRKDGLMMTPTEELQWMLQVFGERFAADSDQPKSRFLQQPLCLQPAQLQQLEKIEVHKAVPKSDPAGVTWRLIADVVAPYVCEYTAHAWYPHHIRIPAIWTSAAMIFLQQPGKQDNEPKHWRPIALQDALGKAVISLVTEHAKPWLNMWLLQYPQCAYVPHRSTSTALRRVYQHCSKVREMCFTQTYSLHAKKAGVQYRPLVGGLQVCLDLSAAFDLLPRQMLEQAMQLARVPNDVQQVLLAWLDQAVYKFEHKQQRGRCRASPILWAAFSGLVCYVMDQKLGAQWAKDHLTIYTADHHAMWELCKLTDLEQAIQELNILHATLKQLEMEANPNKAVAILTCRGNQRQRAIQRWTRRCKQERRSLLQEGDPSQYIPLQSKAVYLGAIISYSNYETQTVQHRIQQARHRYWALT